MRIESVDMFYLSMPEILNIGDGSQDACLVRLRAGFDRRQFISASSDALKQAVRAELQQLFARTDWRRLQPLAQPPAVPLAPSDALQHPSGTMQGTP